MCINETNSRIISNNYVMMMMMILILQTSIKIAIIIVVVEIIFTKTIMRMLFSVKVL